MRRLTLFLILIACAAPAWATTTITWGSGPWYVNTSTGSNNTSCGAVGSPCASLNYILNTITWSNSGTGAAIIECDGNAADATAATVPAKTGTDPTHFIQIQTTGANRHTGTWDATKYRLAVANATALIINNDYTVIDGLQITNSQNGNLQDVVRIGALTNGANQVVISNSILYGGGSGTYYQRGVAANGNYAQVFLFNDLVYNFPSISTSGSFPVYQSATGGVLSVYSSTLIGGYYGLDNLTGTMTAKNVYAGGSTNGDYHGTIGLTTCASSDATGSSSPAGLRSVAVSTTADSTHAGFTNITGGSENYLVKVGSPLVNTGTDTHGDAAPMNFTTDIIGISRPQGAGWDIGAFELSAGRTVHWLIGSGFIK